MSKSDRKKKAAEAKRNKLLKVVNMVLVCFGIILLAIGVIMSIWSAVISGGLLSALSLKNLHDINKKITEAR